MRLNGFQLICDLCCRRHFFVNTVSTPTIFDDYEQMKKFGWVRGRDAHGASVHFCSGCKDTETAMRIRPFELFPPFDIDKENNLK